MEPPRILWTGTQILMGDGPERGTSPIASTECINASRLEIVGRVYRAKGFSDQVVSLLLGGNRNSTKVAYHGAPFDKTRIPCLRI